MPTSENDFLKSIKETLNVPLDGNEKWFLKAFTHRSYANENNLEYDNERLEFLGDTILDLCVAEYLYSEFPEKREGRLSKIKSAVVRTRSLSRMARKLNLSELIRLSKGESKVKRGQDKVLADTLEAYIGALYMSTDLESVKSKIKPLIQKETDRYLEEGGSNYKGQLLEFTQERGFSNPVYTVSAVEGPEHDPVHCVHVKIDGIKYGSGKGSTKKKAEQKAANEALMAIKEQN